MPARQSNACKVLRSPNVPDPDTPEAGGERLKPIKMLLELRVTAFLQRFRLIDDKRRIADEYDIARAQLRSYLSRKYQRAPLSIAVIARAKVITVIGDAARDNGHFDCSRIGSASTIEIDFQLFDRDTLRQIARLINIGAFDARHMIGKQLNRHRVDQWRNQRMY